MWGNNGQREPMTISWCLRHLFIICPQRRQHHTIKQSKKKWIKNRINLFLNSLLHNWHFAFPIFFLFLYLPPFGFFSSTSRFFSLLQYLSRWNCFSSILSHFSYFIASILSFFLFFPLSFFFVGNFSNKEPCQKNTMEFLYLTIGEIDGRDSY